MSNFTTVDPQTFIDESQHLPATGRGAWNRRGIGFDYRYALSPKGTPRLGTQAEKGLDYWATSAGTGAIRHRLMGLDLIGAPAEENIGRFGTEMRDAVKAFQGGNKNPMTGQPLEVDGTVGHFDAYSLWVPVLNQREVQYGIPSNWLRGLVIFESGGLDPGAIGYYIYYPVKDASGQPVLNPDGSAKMRYGGVDRGLEQNNSKANPDVPWTNCFDAGWAINDAGHRLSKRYVDLKADFPHQSASVLWEAAVCSHNSPANGYEWARLGGPPNETSRLYVQGIRNAAFPDPA